MPKPPFPPEVAAFLAQANPSVIASVRPDGSPHTAATWYLLEDDGRILVNMDATRKRLEYIRNDPRVSLTVINEGNWYNQVTLRGRVVELSEDPENKGIDRLSQHYTGDPYARRDQHRVDGWIEVESWYGWNAGKPWTG
jgi:PPOX class probable F420-dependent enzyme